MLPIHAIAPCSGSIHSIKILDTLTELSSPLAHIQKADFFLLSVLFRLSAGVGSYHSELESVLSHHRRGGIVSISVCCATC